MLFSQRKGYKKVSDVIQVNGMNDELRNSLWNTLDMLVWHRNDFLSNNPYLDTGKSHIEGFSAHLWFSYFKKPLDTRPQHYSDVLKKIREYFFACEWYEVYDFIELTIGYFDDSTLTEIINGILEKELSGYRFVNDVCTDITSPQEIEMLESALVDRDFPTVGAHLQRALELLSNRENPDYRNSIKESISAVEALARIISGDEKATLGDALKIIERHGRLHTALRDAFSKLYGYTSDEGGIRHAMLDESKLSAADAKYFLLSCTSFINYLKSKL